MTQPEPAHIPVLVRRIAEYFAKEPLEVLVDCTVGLGGHARRLLEQHPALRLIGLDVDEENLSIAERVLHSYSDRVQLIRADFADLPSVLSRAGIERVDGLLADLGVSSNQIADAARGLSFDADGPLDMRLDQRRKTTAADLVNTLKEGELADLLYFQSQERHSRKIARRICEVRRQGRINSTVMLARLVAAAIGDRPGVRRASIHPATRTFMALRMAVNREKESLCGLLRQAPSVLRDGGRVAVISFHSGEDRLVKTDFRARSREGVYRVLTKRPVVADDGERTGNPRSRSAKLRVAERFPRG